MIAPVLAALLLCHVAFAAVIDTLDEEAEFLEMLRSAAEREESPTAEIEYLDYLRATGRDEEFAKVMGIEDVSLVRPSKDDEREDKDFRFSRASPLGDILLPKKDAEGRQAIDLNKYRGSRWSNNRIPYEISGDFSSSQRRFIASSIEKMNDQVSNIKVVPRRRERDYVYIISGDGCWSYLGKTGGKQTMSLQKNGCLSTGTVQHEFIHAIGFTHEHNRADRDSYVEVLWNNIPPEWHSQYEKVDESDFKNIQTYDHTSVMHYPEMAPGTNKPAFRMANGNSGEMGQRDGVSDMDVKKIDEYYS